MKKIAQVFLLLLTCQLAVAQWSQVTIPGNFNYNGVHLLNTTNYFMGAHLLMESNNGGSAWSQHPLISATDGVEIWGGAIEDVHFFDANTGVVAGYFLFGSVGYILRTTDGGATWNVVSEFDQDVFPFIFNDMHFIPNTEIGYAVGTNGKLVKTIDSGQTWSQQFTGTTNNLYGVHFVDANNGFAVGDNIFLKTTNGGATWTSSLLQALLPERVFFVDSQTGYIGGGGLLQKTTDGGATWQDLSFTLPAGLFYARDFYFPNANTGYVLTSDYILKTNDGGQLWEYQSISSPNAKCSRFDWLNPSVAVISGENGRCWKTGNGGGNYKPIAKFETLGGATDFCAGVSYPLSNLTQASPNYTYAWYLNGVLFSTAVSPNIIFPSGGTVYEIKLVVNNGLASDTYVKNVVTYSDIPPYSQDFYATSATICQGEGFFLKGNNMQYGTAPIDWQLLANGQQTTLGGTILSLDQYLMPDTTTTYTLMGTYAWYCDSIAILKEVTVEVVPLGLPINIQPQDSSVCIGDSTQLLIYNSVPGVQYALYSTCIGQPNYQMGNGGTLSFPSGVMGFQSCEVYYSTSNGSCQNGSQNPLLIPYVYPSAGIEQVSYEVTTDMPLQPNSGIFQSFDYLWTFGANALPPTSSDPNATVVFPTPGIYPINLEAYAGDCSNDYDATVEVFPSNNMPALDGSFCVDTLTDLSYHVQLGGDIIMDVEMGADGNVYVTGYGPDSSYVNGTSCIFIRKYDTAGNLLFSSHISAADTTYYGPRVSFGTSIAADAEGNIYLGGTFDGVALTLGGETIYTEGMFAVGEFPTGFIAKLDPNGHVIWHLFISSVENIFDLPAGPSDIIWGNDGRLIVSLYGYVNFIAKNNGHRYDGLRYINCSVSMLQLNADGDMVALRPLIFGNSIHNGFYNISPSSIGFSTTTIGGPRMELLKNGNIVVYGEIWKMVYVGKFDFGYELTPRTQNSRDGFAIITNLDGEVQSFFNTYGYVHGGYRDPVLERFAVDGEGNIYQSASLRNSYHDIFYEQDAYFMVQDSTKEYGADKNFILKYSPQGELLWKLRNGSLDVDQLAFLDGKLYGLARYDNFLGLNSTNGDDKFSLPAQGLQDLALVAWTPEGEPVGALPMSSPNVDVPFFMLNDGCGKLVSLYAKDLPIPFVAPTFTHIATYAPESDCMPACPLTCILPPQTSPFCNGEEAHLYMGATGESLNYQWQQLQGGSYINITDGAVYSGTNTASLNIAADQAPGLVNELYRCIVTDGSGAQIVTEGAKIVSATPIVAPLFDSITIFQPIPSISIILEAGATGEWLSYQWQVFTNGVWVNMDYNIGSYQTHGDSLILDFPNSSFEGLGFRCIVESGFGCQVISDSTFLHIDTPTEAVYTATWSFSLSPNPSGKSTMLDVRNLTGNWDWTLVDDIGIIRATGKASNSSATINMEAYSSGIYWVRVRSGEQTLVKKLVKGGG